MNNFKDVKRMENKAKVIYFADAGGDLEEEKETIEKLLKRNEIFFDIKAVDLPPFDEKFDVLFFDWGGISVGNSMLEHFCRYIINHAEDHPGNVYVMTSQMTEAAMIDALSVIPDRPENIYLDIGHGDTLMALKVFSNR